MGELVRMSNGSSSMKNVNEARAQMEKDTRSAVIRMRVSLSCHLIYLFYY